MTNPKANVNIFTSERATLAVFQQEAKSLIEPVLTKESISKASLDVYLDTEYVQQPNKPNKMLTTQAVLKSGKGVILEHPDLAIGRLPSWDGNDTIFPSLLGQSEATYDKRNDNILTIRCHLFFAPSDILAGLMLRKKALKLQRDMQQEGRITLLKKRDSGDIETAVWIDGVIFNIKIVPIDYGKLFGQKGLAATAEALGLKMLTKGAMDDYKTNMLIPYLDDEMFPMFRDYAMDDAHVLTLFRAAKDAVDSELFAVQGLAPERSYDTPGSLVSGIQIGYIQKHCGADGKGWEALATTDAKGNEKPWKLKDLTKLSTTSAMAIKDGRAPLLALVQGGRAKNNIPARCRFDSVVADLDAAGFYSVAQSLTPYCLGFPSIYNTSTSAGAERMTLGAFMKHLGGDLFPRCYSIVVSGALSFPQSLIHSKITTADNIRRGYNPDNPDVDAPLLLLSHEIKNGVITSDVYDCLQRVCSNKEMKEMKNLIVETAMFYRTRYRFTDADKWAKAMQEHTATKGQGTAYKMLGKGFNDGDSLSLNPPYWLDISFQDFIEINNKARAEKKAERDKCAIKSDEWAALNVLQDNIKLVNNTSYGVQASAFFDVANVCFANNVTAMGRTCIWLASRTLGGHQDITDGFIYSLDNVLIKGDKQPSMETLTLRYHPEMLSRDTRKILKMGHLLGSEAILSKANNGEQMLSSADGLFSETARKEGFKRLDKIAQQHVNDYWTAKDGSVPSCLQMFNVSHKNVYSGGAYRGQTDYATLEAEAPDMNIKARGHRLDKARYRDSSDADWTEEDTALEMSQMAQLLSDIATCPNNVRVPKAQQSAIILKINAANKMATSSTGNVFQEHSLLAGDSIIKNVRISPISLSMFCYRTLSQHGHWLKAVEKLKTRTGEGLEQYYLNDDGTIRYQDAIIDIDRAILLGKNPPDDFSVLQR